MEWSTTVSSTSLRRAFYSVALFIAPAVTLLASALVTGNLGRALAASYGSNDEVLPSRPMGE